MFGAARRCRYFAAHRFRGWTLGTECQGRFTIRFRFQNSGRTHQTGAQTHHLGWFATTAGQFFILSTSFTFFSIFFFIFIFVFRYFFGGAGFRRGHRSDGQRTGNAAAVFIEGNNLDSGTSFQRYVGIDGTVRWRMEWHDRCDTHRRVNRNGNASRFGRGRIVVGFIAVERRYIDHVARWGRGYTESQARIRRTADINSWYCNYSTFNLIIHLNSIILVDIYLQGLKCQCVWYHLNEGTGSLLAIEDSTDAFLEEGGVAAKREINQQMLYIRN